LNSKPRLPRAFRLFLALWPDDAVRHAIGEHARAWSLPSDCVRYGPLDWHVTLHFLGSVPTERVPEIAAGVDVPLEPFELALDQPLMWPRGLAVVIASQVPPALKVLHDRLGHALRDMEQAVELRPYRPHLTLARRADGAVRPRAAAPVVWPVRSFALVVSTGRTDHRYEVLRIYG
jgi:2'-5' RNA ligase